MRNNRCKKILVKKIIIDTKDNQYYRMVSIDTVIQIQDWIVKHHNVIHSPITEDTLLIKDECIGKYFHLLLFVIHLYY